MTTTSPLWTPIAPETPDHSSGRSAEVAEQRTGGAASSVYAAITRLHEAGVIRPLTDRTRNQVWVVASVADELDSLSVRIGERARDEMTF